MALLLVLACGDARKDEHRLTSEEYAKLTSMSNELNVPSVHSNMILDIPTQGCGSCIQAALEFTARNAEQSELAVIVSSRSTKLASLLLSKYKINPERIRLDKEGLSQKYGLITIYPVLFKSSGDYTVAVQLDASNIKEELTKVGLAF